MQKTLEGFLSFCKKCGDHILIETDKLFLAHTTKYCEFCKPKKHYLYSTAKWQCVRIIALKRDNFVCQYCGKPADTVDHVIPLFKKGTSEINNLKSACRSCNSKKFIN